MGKGANTLTSQPPAAPLGGKLRDSPGLWGWKHLPSQVISQHLHKALQTSTAGWAERRDSVKVIIEDWVVFLNGVQLPYDVLVSAVQRSDSATGTHVSPPSWPSLPPTSPRSSQSTKLSSLCRTASPHQLFVYTWWGALILCSVLHRGAHVHASQQRLSTWWQGWGRWTGHNRSLGLFVFFHFVQTE